MPIVPVVEQNPTGMPTVQAPAAAPMHNYEPQQQEQLGATTQAAGEASMRANQAIALHIQSQMDDANVKAAESKFIQSATDTLHGDKGYMNLRGADAINGYDQASESLVKAKKDILDSLSNDVQKVQFNRISQQHLVTLGAQMSQHRAQQRVEYTAAQSMARADSMRSMAQNSDIGSADQNKYIETGVQETQNALAAKGIPVGSEQSLEAERKFRSQITADNISRLMEDGKYTEANAILTEAQSKNQVEGDTADRLRRAIRGNLQRTENIQQAETIFAPYQGKQVRATDLEDMLGKAQKIENPEQRQHVQDMVRAKFNEQHTMQAAEYRDNLNDVVNIKAQYGASFLKHVPPDKWSMLSKSDQSDLQATPATQTDLNTWYKFKTQPDQLTLPNVNEAFSKGLLSKGDWRGLVEEAQKLQNKPEYVQEAGDIGNRINFMASQAGLNVYGQANGKVVAQTPDDKIKHAQLTIAVQNEIERIKQQTHGKITGQQVDEIINRQLKQQILQTPTVPRQTVPSDAWNPFQFFNSKPEPLNKRRFEMPPSAVGIGVGEDGKKHYVDAQNNDLGLAE